MAARRFECSDDTHTLRRALHASTWFSLHVCEALVPSRVQILLVGADCPATTSVVAVVVLRRQARKVTGASPRPRRQGALLCFTVRLPESGTVVGGEEKVKECGLSVGVA